MLSSSPAFTWAKVWCARQGKLPIPAFLREFQAGNVWWDSENGPTNLRELYLYLP
jgi:hypothetical protein